MTHEAVTIGLFVIFGVVLLPVYAMLIGWFAGKPREFRTPLLALGYVIGLIVLLTIVTWIGGQIAGLFMPY